MVDFRKALEQKRNQKMTNDLTNELDEVEVDNYIDDDDFDGDEIDTDDVAGFGDIFVEGLADALAEANAPALSPGEYLARVVAITPKTGTTKTPPSFGLNVHIVVNKNPNALTEGWRAGDPVLEIKNNYVYVGQLIGGKVKLAEKIFAYSALHKSLGLPDTGVIAGARDAGKVIRVKTYLEADSREAAPEPGVPDERQKFVKIKTHMPYRDAAGNVAPLLTIADEE